VVEIIAMRTVAIPAWSTTFWQTNILIRQLSDHDL
jgi:hypothetical protein